MTPEETARKTPDTTQTALVEFRYFDAEDKEILVRFYVPSSLLWHAYGLETVFNTCREAHLGDEKDAGSDPWNSWHLASVSTPDDAPLLVTRIDWDEEL